MMRKMIGEKNEAKNNFLIRMILCKKKKKEKQTEII